MKFLGIWYRDIFKELVLNSSPFEPVKISTDIIKSVKKPGSGQTVDIPEAFKTNELIDKDIFSEHVTMRKSAEKYKDIYYNFYQAMYNLFTDSALTKENYKALTDIIYGSDRSAIRSGFLINAPLNTGNKSRILPLDNFKRKNAQSEWFDDSIPFNEQFYTQYVLSSSINLTKEYSDTLLRLFSATGIFNFNGALPEMLYGELFSTVFTHIDIESLIFDDTTAWGYENYEGGANSFYGNHTTLTEILKLENNDVDAIITELHEKYGADDIQSTLMGIKRERMKEHVKDKYPKDKIIELLSYVSDRNNDEHIKKYINSGANVPTIYEYIVTIAWYYISGEDFSILDSFNLELNGNFEPLRHAAGGQGDIEIFYDDGRVVMLEVTLMNKQAQKRGEWEPVLRHSINLKADNEDKETTTLFIADELDNNSINIWRAVASVPLEASSSGKETDKVFIMPFTNKEIIGFLTDNISGKRIIQSVRDSFEHMDFLFDKEWRNKILNSI